MNFPLFLFSETLLCIRAQLPRKGRSEDDLQQLLHAASQGQRFPERSAEASDDTGRLRNRFPQQSHQRVPANRCQVPLRVQSQRSFQHFPSKCFFNWYYEC